jgi:hypothetical protein
MELPMYCIVGDRPVKAVSTSDGGMDVLAYDWDTGDFERDLTYLNNIIQGGLEVTVVTEAEFNRRVQELAELL